MLVLTDNKVLLHIQILHSDTFCMCLFAQLKSCAFPHNNAMLLGEKYLSNINGSVSE